MSVGGILSQNANRNDEQSSKTIKRLEGELQKLQEEKSEIDRRLRTIRESEIHPQTIANGRYSGTAARIAQKVKEQERSLSWFTDTVPLEQTCPLKNEDLIKFLTKLRDLTPDKKGELTLEWPESVTAPEHFEELVANERRAVEKEQTLSHNADTHLADILSNVNTIQIKNLHDSLKVYLNAYANLSRKPFTWIPDAVRNTLANGSAELRHLQVETRDIINDVESLVKLADGVQIDRPQAVDDMVLLEDAKQLKSHLENGGGLGWWLFRPKAVSARLYVIEKVRINGQKADDTPKLQILIQALRVRIGFQKAWKLWNGRCDRNSELYSQQLVQLKELCGLIEEIASLENTLTKLRSFLHECHGLQEPDWNDIKHLRILLNSCALALARKDKKSAHENISDIEMPLTAIVNGGKAHPVVQEILNSIQQRDCTAFARNVRIISMLNHEKSSIQWVEAYLDELQLIVPNLTESLIQTAEDTSWDTRIKQGQDAWYWMQAKIWVEEYIRKEGAPELAIRLERIEKKISENIAEMASLRAWSFCFRRLTNSHREHMIGWQQAMRKIGKGTGKYAFLHRREAQVHLNECREAVPAWVMPLHKVWDTVNPESGMFDVIVVDEASQCGPEALPLLYLGKKMLIVGDDKQISPEAVGVGRDAMFGAMKEFLHDFSHSDSFDLESSLFDHAVRRFHMGRITLREHFRCMPEIIRFSNDLCYRDTRLIPLRQYGPNRLAPLERVFVPKGYREGSGSEIINRPEAIAIAKKIEKLCRDGGYAGKTMGVVTLQGHAQAKIIQDALMNLIGAEEMENRKIVCGDPYNFQGDERDIIFLSMVAAPNEATRAFTQSADERRFNVAASRAKDQLWLFHSVKREDLNPNCLRRKLLEFFEGTKPQTIAGMPLDELERKAYHPNRMLGNQPEPFDSWFEVDVALELALKGYTVIPQYHFADWRIDLVIEGGNARLAIECDGDNWHGPEQYDNDMSRQRQLERCGWVFFRVRESAFRLDKNAALNGLWRLLEERGIMPWQCEMTSTPDARTNESKYEQAENNEVNDKGGDTEGDEDDIHMPEDSDANDNIASPRLEEISSLDIRDAIFHALEKCPNNTCTLKSITGRVLKDLGVITRGKPREKFEKRIMAVLNRLEEETLIERYKAKNKRIRLLTPNFPTTQVGKEGQTLPQKRTDTGAEDNVQRELEFNQTSSNHPFHNDITGKVEVEVDDTVVYIDLGNTEIKKKVRITRDISHPEYGIINVATPIAQELLGARVGDIVEVILPDGPARLQIKEIIRS